MSSESRQMEQLNSQNSTLQEEVMRLRSQLKCGAVTRAKSLQALVCSIQTTFFLVSTLKTVNEKYFYVTCSSSGYKLTLGIDYKMVIDLRNNCC